MTRMHQIRRFLAVCVAFGPLSSFQGALGQSPSAPVEGPGVDAAPGVPGSAALGQRRRVGGPDAGPAPGAARPPIPLPPAARPYADLVKEDPAVAPARFQGRGQDDTTTPPAAVDSNPDASFGRRLIDAYFPPKDAPTPPPTPGVSRRGLPSPFQSPPFPFSDYIGPLIGTRDETVWPLMNALYAGKNGQAWKDSRIKIYGWFDPSVTFGTSKNSNIPMAYNIVPNKLELSQAILIFERQVDTAQTDHADFGFKVTNLYGIDYRYTTAKGYFSDQLLKHNHLYGYDPLQLYVDLYTPRIAQGMVLRIGRYISPIDIEAQLSPENYLYSHSVMYTYDPYTFTGIQAITKLNDQWHLTLGIHGGNDVALWTTSTQPNAEILLKWVSKDNKDSLFGGIDSIGRGKFLNGHDDLQVLALTWSHKFSDKFQTMTEGYYIFQHSALLGGTVTNGNPHPYFPGVGPGKLIPGTSDALGVVNYTSYKLNDKAIIVGRSDLLADFQGQRTGFATTYFEHTLGYVRHITPWLILRPEVRFDYSSGAKAYDNGTKREMFTFNADLILRF